MLSEYVIWSEKKNCLFLCHDNKLSKLIIKKKKTFITQKISFEGKKKFLISKNKQSKDMVILKQVKWTYQWRLEMELLWWQKIYPRQFQWDLFSIFMKVFFQNFWRLFYNYFVIPTATSLNILWGKKGCFDFKMVFFFFSEPIVSCK